MMQSACLSTFPVQSQRRETCFKNHKQNQRGKKASKLHKENPKPQSRGPEPITKTRKHTL